MATGLLILDGGMGDELRKKAPDRAWDPFALRDHAEEVVATHAEYIAAGATVIETWNYSVTSHWLRGQPHLANKPEAEIQRELADLTKQSVRLAKQARDECGAPHVLIAGTLPPLGASFDSDEPLDLLTAEPVDMQASYIAMAAALEEEGCDLFLIETCARISVAQAALAACRWVNPSKTVWLAMTLQDTKPVLWSGETVAELVATFDSPGGEDGAATAPDAILFNCSPPEVVHAALLELRPIFAGRTGGYANRRGARATYGHEQAQLQKVLGTEITVNATREDLSPEAYASWAVDWIQQGGGSILGGCCGVSPAHIRAVAQACIDMTACGKTCSPQSSLSSAANETETCAICLGGLSRPVELSCSHRFCWVCLSGASSTNYSCPLCRTKHILDPAMLRERRDTFRAGYRAWRQGGFKGAAGEIEDVSVMKPAHEPTRPRDATDCAKHENKRCELLGEPADEQAGEPDSKRKCCEMGSTLGTDAAGRQVLTWSDECDELAEEYLSSMTNLSEAWGVDAWQLLGDDSGDEGVDEGDLDFARELAREETAALLPAPSKKTAAPRKVRPSKALPTPALRAPVGNAITWEKQQIAVCPQDGCDFLSHSASHLARHLRSHTNERPFACLHPGCNYAARQKQHLHTHSLKHSVARPFECRDCGFATKRKDHLARHHRRHHEAAGAPR